MRLNKNTSAQFNKAERYRGPTVKKTKTNFTTPDKIWVYVCSGKSKKMVLKDRKDYVLS